jgi:hypothetical protein
MTNWLERARRELSHKRDNGLPLTPKILPDVGNLTVVTVERSPTAVLAVPQLSKSGISGVSIGSNGSTPNGDSQENSPVIALTLEEEGVLRRWLAQIGEADVEMLWLGRIRAYGLNAINELRYVWSLA